MYGEEETRFAQWFRDGDLFRIRNAALYFEVNDDSFKVPSDVISAEDAFLLVCISGEVFAEIQGFYLNAGPDNWQHILSEIHSFQEAGGMVTS